MPTIDLRDKFKGCIAGAAIGDALGYEVEFCSMADIRRRFPDGLHLCRRELNGERVAFYSDDTQMARAVSEGLIRAGRSASLDAAASEIAEDFIAWYRSAENNRAPGAACMAGCAKLASGKVPWREAGGPVNNEGAGGCGSVMRSHPYGLFYFEDRERAMTTAAEHSRLTHGAPLAMAASAALAVGVWAALRDYDPARIASFMQDAAYKYDQATGDMLVQAEASASDKFCETDDMLDMWRGWAGHEAIAAALFVFLREVDAGHEDVVLTAATSPGDSDSIASIAGALAGAFHGFAAIRSDWVEALEKSDELQALAFRLLRSSTPADRLYLLEVEEEDYAAPFPDEENTRQTVS